MAALFKIWIKRYVDATGKRIAKGSPGARAIRERSRKWYGEYQDAEGRTRRVPLATDKSAAQAKLGEILKKVERKQAGLFDPYESHEARPLTEHLDDYRLFLRSKGSTEKHVSQTIKRIETLLKGCEFEHLRDLDAHKVTTWLAEQREHAKRFSVQTSNFYGDMVKAFGNWLVTNDRIARNPLASLRRLNVEVDRRHDRRALSEDEFRRLIESAANGPVSEGMSGEDRAMLYVLATWTGFRRGELAALTRRNLELDLPTPTISLPAKASKRRKAELMPLHPAVVDALRVWLDRKPATDPNAVLFELTTSKGHFRKTSKMMKLDLERAGIPYRNEEGLFADFHANRHTFISNLSRAGVSLVTAQKLARHSDPKLTANRYTHLGLETEAAAIGSLPVVPSASPKSQVDPAPVDLVAVPVAVKPVVEGHPASPDGIEGAIEGENPKSQKPLPEQGFRQICQFVSQTDTVHSIGFEPITFGSEVRNLRLPAHFSDSHRARRLLTAQDVTRAVH